MADNVGGALTPLKGLVYDSKISIGGSTTTFTINSLKNFPAGFFIDWSLMVMGKNDKTITAPLTEKQPVLSYDYLTGGFVTPAFTANLVKDDEIYLIHPSIASILPSLADINDVSAFTSTGGIQDNQYESWQDKIDISQKGLANYKNPILRHHNDTEVSTNSTIYTTVKTATVTKDIIGGCTIYAGIKIANAIANVSINVLLNNVSIYPNTINSTSYVTQIFPLSSANTGDVITLQLLTSNASLAAYLCNFQIYYSVESQIVRIAKGLDAYQKKLTNGYSTPYATSPFAGQISSVHYYMGYLYVGTNSSPATVYKVDPVDFTVVDAWTGATGENVCTGITNVGDSWGASGMWDKSPYYIFVCLATSPAKVIPIDVTTMTTKINSATGLPDTWTGAAGENAATCILGFGLYLYTGLTMVPGRVVQINSAMTTTNEWVGGAGQDNVASLVADPSRVLGLGDIIVAGLGVNPAQMVQILTTTMATNATWTSVAGYSGIYGLAFDGSSYFGTCIRVAGPSIVKVSNTTMTTVATLTTTISGDFYTRGIKFDGTNLYFVSSGGGGSGVLTVYNVNPNTLVVKSYWRSDYRNITFLYDGIDSDGKSVFVGSDYSLRKIVLPSSDYVSVGVIIGALAVPTADAVTNVYMRDVIGNKTDTAKLIVGTTYSQIAYLKALINQWTGVPVTEATSATQCKASALIGLGETTVLGWWMQCVWDAGGAAAAPQGEWRQITAYTSTTGLLTFAAFSVNLALTDRIKIVPPEIYETMTIRGGGETIQSVRDDQNAMLDIARSPQSASTLMIIPTEVTLYEESDTNPFAFLGGFIDLSVLAAGDTVLIRVYVKIKSGGIYRRLSDDVVNGYSGVQTVPLKHINGPGDVYNFYGIKITATQSAGTARVVDHCWYDGK
jgi:hypothetical protein